jgi:dTDP-4-dehydrorhamnose 3,5-epimerase
LPYAFEPLPIPGVVAVATQVFADARGFFEETYTHSAFADAGIRERFVQDNHSRSRHRVLRGLHYQKRAAAQGKLVSVIRGAVYDVAVDLRLGSPTFARWVGVVLSEENHRMLYVPPGCAHGFVVLSEVADVVYKVTHEYSPAHDRGVRWDDPTIGVDWPLRDPILSEKDCQLPTLAEADLDFPWGGTL